MNNLTTPRWTSKLSDTDLALLEDGHFTVDAAAARLSVSTRWVYQAISKSDLPAQRVGMRWIIQKADVDRILGVATGQDSGIHSAPAEGARS